MENLVEKVEIVLDVSKGCEAMVAKIVEVNSKMKKFVLEFQKIDGKVITNLSMFESFAVGENEFLIYVQEEICRYLERISKAVRPLRFEPWMKPSGLSVLENIEIHPDLLQYKGTEHYFFNVPVSLLPVPFVNDMLMPKEYFFFKSLTHHNIATAFGLSKINEIHYIVITKSEQTVKTLIQAQTLSNFEKKSLMLQLASVIWYLHSKNILIYLLEPDQVYVDAELQVKIQDFTDAEILSDEDSKKSDGNSRKIDIFALGNLWFYIITGQFFDSEAVIDSSELNDLIKNMKSGNENLTPTAETAYKTLKNIIF